MRRLVNVKRPVESEEYMSSIRCSIRGEHEWDDEETRTETDDEGQVTTRKRLQSCKRCGEEKVLKKKTRISDRQSDTSTETETVTSPENQTTANDGDQSDDEAIARASDAAVVHQDANTSAPTQSDGDTQSSEQGSDADTGSNGAEILTSGDDGAQTHTEPAPSSPARETDETTVADGGGSRDASDDDGAELLEHDPSGSGSTQQATTEQTAHKTDDENSSVLAAGEDADLSSHVAGETGEDTGVVLNEQLDDAEEETDTGFEREPDIICPECGHGEYEEAALYLPGDSCPECHHALLEMNS